MLNITARYAAVLGMLFLVLSLMVINRRRVTGIGLGDGAQDDMQRAIRGHANFAEYTPFILLLMAIMELG